MSLRSDIHAALDAVAAPAPHLPSTVVDAIHRLPPPRRRWPAAGLATGMAVVLLAAGAFAATRHVSPQQAPAASPAPGHLALTTWVTDPSVTAGPYPGYRPQLSGFASSMLRTVQAEPSPQGGTDWVVTVTLDPSGTALVSQLTTAASGACGQVGPHGGFGGPGSCPGSHVTDWLDLTQEDVDHWNERAGALYRPADNGGKLLSDPYVQAPIPDGTFLIQGNLTRQEAMTLARRLHP